MKKTYINPNIEVVKIQTQQMLANSPQVGINSTGDAVDAGNAAARGFYFEDE